MIISVNDASFSYGDNLIFGGVNFAVNEGERIGLIGVNGVGKTTLIQMILGGLTPESGTVIRKSGARIGYLEQSGGYQSGNSVYEEMRLVFKEELNALEKLETLSAQLSSTAYESREYAVLSAKIESLNKFIRSRDCYGVDVKIKTVLNGMGFENRYGQIIDTMSGGEKTRLKLARLLLETPDLLILDEPTNHLDVGTLFWLEEYLSTFSGAILTVSHDRYFLDKVCTRTVEIENKKVTCFTGNYSKYKILKAELYARQLKEYEAQVEERKKLQDYVDRNIVRATTAKSALSRVNKLERMEILEKPVLPPKPPHFKFTSDITPSETVLKIEDLNLEIGGKRLICGGQLQIRRGQKVALVGENGTGKSTLLKRILSKDDKNIELGRSVKIAAFDQESANLDGDKTVLAELWDRHLGLTQTEVRSALARAGLFEEDMQKPVRALSGGERAKLALCVLECENGNFLLLDEPTNHLDLPARESLEKALKEFDGTLLFVSHDRYFLSALAEKVVEISDDKLVTYDGDYAYYTEMKSIARQQARAAKEEKAQKEREEKKISGYRSKAERAEKARLAERVKRIERDICDAEKREEEINFLLQNPQIAADYTKLQPLLEELGQIKNRLDALYKEYESVL